MKKILNEVNYVFRDIGITPHVTYVYLGKIVEKRTKTIIITWEDPRKAKTINIIIIGIYYMHLAH